MSLAPLLCRVSSPAARSAPVRFDYGRARASILEYGGRGAGVRHLRLKHGTAPSYAIKDPRTSGPVSRGQTVGQGLRWLSSKKDPQDIHPPGPADKPPTATSEPVKTTTKLLDRVKSLTPHENIYTIPNILTFSRLALTPVIGYLVLNDHHSWAIGLFAYAGITDLVDGWIARRFKQQTVVGTVIDPMADKALMTVLTVALAIKGALPAYLAVIIIGRDVLLAISAIYYRYISLPPPKTFARYWDFSLPSAEVHPTGISKINTALQLGLIGWTVCMPMLTGYGSGIETALVGMQYLVATTTVWSGLSYVYTKDAVKILTEKDIEERRQKAEAKD